MRRLCSWLLFLAACTGSSQGTMPTPMSPSTCPVYPEPACPETVCPDKPCPAYAPVAPPPVASDWHCFVMRGFTDGDIGLCQASAAGCEKMRKLAKSQKGVRSSPCATRATAYCFGITQDNSWHRHCTPTLADCEFSLARDREHPSDEPEELGTCQLTRNINPLDAAARFNSAAPSTH